MTSTFSNTVRRGLIAGSAVLVLGGAAVGVVNAQTQPTPPPANAQQNGRQAFVDALAKRLGISSSALQSAIDQARADAGLPASGPGFGLGMPGPGGPGGRAFPGGRA